MESYNMTVKDLTDKVSGKFIYAITDFSVFKRGESYWLEYIGNDTYVGRSDNILNQKITITPFQLDNYFSETAPTKFEMVLAEWFYGIRTQGLTSGETNENLCDRKAHIACKDLLKYIDL